MIVNPNAGKKQINKYLHDIRGIFRQAGHSIRVLHTKKQGDAELYANRFADKADIIVCCGGDGTLSETVNGFMKLPRNKRPLLGYIPSGTTNDFANSLGLPSNPIEAAKIIIRNRQNYIDVGRFNDRHFVYLAYFGAFSKVSYSTQQSMKNVFGHLAYILEGLKELPSLSTYNIKLTADDRRLEEECILGVVSNTTSIAGVIKIDDDLVSLNDGLFEIMIIKYPQNPVDFSRIIKSLNSGDYDDEYITFLHSNEIEVELSRHTAWSLDGEHSPETKLVKIKNIHNAIKLVH